jgi:pterin-4a-carbinolamine dehydratase
MSRKKKVGFELPAKAHLKSERLQESTPERAYLKSERLQEALGRLPGWTLTPGHGGIAGIARARAFDSSRGARSFVGLVCRLAVGQGQPVEIRLEGTKVVVKLSGHPVRGCTGGLGQPVLNLAEMIG